MKKIISFLFAICSFVSLSAQEDLVQIEPCEVQPGILVNDGEVLSLKLMNTAAYKLVELSLYLPEGMSIDMEYPGDLGDRCPILGTSKKPVPQHELTITDHTKNGYYKVLLSPKLSATQPTFDEGDGSVIDFYILTSPDLKPGIYPIYIKDALLAIDGYHGVYPKNTVSFVTVKGDEGANSILDLEDYLVPSFVEEVLPTSNVVKNGVCENLVITDKVPFYNSKEFVAKKASYTREATGYNWGTICLPFVLESTSGLSLQALQSISGNTMEFSEVPSTIAYAPYAYCTPEPTALNISVENVTVPVYVDGTYGVAPIVMKSVMKEPVTLEKGSNAYYIANDQFWTPTVNPVNVTPMRAYYDIEGAGVKCFGIEGVSTAINGTEAGAAIEGVYNANGAAQKGMKKGVNLVKYSDGTTQKIIIK